MTTELDVIIDPNDGSLRCIVDHTTKRKIKIADVRSATDEDDVCEEADEGAMAPNLAINYSSFIGDKTDRLEANLTPFLNDSGCSAIIWSQYPTQSPNTRFPFGCTYLFDPNAHRHPSRCRNFPFELNYSECTCIAEVEPLNTSFGLTDEFFNKNWGASISRLTGEHEKAPGVISDPDILKGICSNICSAHVKNDPVTLPYYPIEEWIPCFQKGSDRLSVLSSDLETMPPEYRETKKGRRYYLLLKYTLPMHVAEQVYQSANIRDETWDDMIESKEFKRAKAMTEHAIDELMMQVGEIMQLRIVDKAVFKTHVLERAVTQDGQPMIAYYAGTQCVGNRGALVELPDGKYAWFQGQNGWLSVETANAISTKFTEDVCIENIGALAKAGFAQTDGFIYLQERKKIV